MTSLTYTANLAKEGKAASGVAGGDSICNEHARQAKLGGVWVAWLSSSSKDAIDRIADVGPWYFVDGTTQIFTTRFQIPNGPLVALNMDELGGRRMATRVWTGTDRRGRHDTTPRRGYYPDSCNDWTDNTSGTGVVGWTDYVSSWSVTETPALCTELCRLYCFES